MLLNPSATTQNPQGQGYFSKTTLQAAERIAKTHEYEPRVVPILLVAHGLAADVEEGAAILLALSLDGRVAAETVLEAYRVAAASADGIERF